MPARVSLSAAEARGLALRAQRFGEPPRPAIDVLDELGAIQLDSVNVLERNHALVPFARLGRYSKEELHEAIYGKKRGFEYWGHMASWLPMSDYRYFLPRMQRMRRESRGWWARIRVEHADLYEPVLRRINDEGPLGAVAFEDPRGGRGTWWDWKPAKLVLEDLLDQGILMCAERTAGFARIYDLAERVLPAGLDVSDPGEVEATRHLLLRGVGALGVATLAEAADYYRLKAAQQPKQRIGELLDAGDVVEVEVEGWRTLAYSTPATLELPTSTPEHPPTFLAPFDNLLWERSRLERLFNFHYRVEIYVPEPKRQFGYFVLPLLVRGELLGRADLKLDRKAGLLRVRGLWLEGAEPGEAHQALERLAQQLGAADLDLP